MNLRGIVVGDGSKPFGVAGGWRRDVGIPPYGGREFPFYNAILRTTKGRPYGVMLNLRELL